MTDIDNFLNQLASFYTAEPVVREQNLTETLASLYDKDQVSYQIDTELFFDELNRAISAPFISEGLKETDERKLAIIPYLFNGQGHHFFLAYIKSREGIQCAGDKAAFIIRQIKTALREGQNVSLVQNYSEQDLGGEKYKDMQAYWSPHCIPDTDKAISLFFDWYKFLENIPEEKAQV